MLIIEDDQDLLALLALNARARHHRSLTAHNLADARRLIASETFAVALVDLALGSDSGLEAVRAIKDRAPDTEIIVISATTSLASAIASYELDAFAFVPKPFDLDQLFATVDRAIEHRRVVLANRRLVWEQRLINELGEDLRKLVAPAEIVDRVLRRLTLVLGVDSAAARLYNHETGEYDFHLTSGSAEVLAAWSGSTPLVLRPSDNVLATRTAVRIGDLHQLLTPDAVGRMPLRSALSVPMLVGDQLAGVLSLGSPEPHRFTEEDQRLLCIIANQVAVAVQNAQLHVFVRTGKQEWEATFDAIGDPIAVFDRHGRLLRGNTALGAHLNRAVTKLKGLSCDEVGLCGGTFPNCAVGRAAGQSCMQAEVGRPGGQIFSVTTCPVTDATDGAAVVQIAKNVTRDIQNARRMRQMSDEIAGANERLVATLDRLKNTQAQLLQAEKLSAIGQLVAGVAHELNNPLTSVIGYAQLLQEEVRNSRAADSAGAESQFAHDLRRIAEESERAARIVRNLLAFARRQSAERAPQDIADIMSRVLALRTYEFRLSAIEVETEFEPLLPPVLGDGGQLQQALLNLLLNAEQALRTRPVRSIRVGARLVPEASAVELWVADSGHGIPDENLRRIFDPFFTTRQVGEGTGLGLSICYGIVRDHGGQITVDSRVGEGTTFRILLPARADEAGPPLTVLVAHRDPTERDYVVAALTGWRHKVIGVETAVEARGRLAAEPIDVALIDQALIAADPPAWIEAMDLQAGLALVVLTSASDDDRTARWVRGADSAGNAVVASPFELSALHLALGGKTKEYV